MGSTAILIFMLFLPLNVLSGFKIIDRFGGSYPKNAVCRILYPKAVADILNGDLKERFSAAIDSILDGFRVIKYLNCSSSEFEVDGDPFAMLPNGTYTSAIGLIQRKEAEMVTILVRPDSLPNEPGIIGPVLFEAEAVIVSKRVSSELQRTTRQLTAFFSDIPDLNYFFINITVFIFVVTFLIMEYRNLPVNQRISTKKLLIMFENVFHGFSDALNLEAQTMTGRIVLGSFFVFLFFFVYGLFLCKVGADLVSLKGAEEMEQIEEIIEDPKLGAITLKQLFLVRVLEAEVKYRPDSQLAQLKRKMDLNPKSVIDVAAFAADVSAGLMANEKLFQGVIDNKVAIIAERSLIKYHARINCVANTKMAMQVRPSKTTFAPGTLSFLLSHEVDPTVLKVLEYFLRVQREGSLIDSYTEAIKEATIDALETPVTVKTLECQLGINETLSDIRMGMDSFRQLSINDYEMVFLGLGYALAFSFLILVSELLYSQVVMKPFRGNKTELRVCVHADSEGESVTSSIERTENVMRSIAKPVTVLEILEASSSDYSQCARDRNKCLAFETKGSRISPADSETRKLARTPLAKKSTAGTR